MFRLIGKYIRWFFRRWQKTNRGKWHISTRTYPGGVFVPACCPWAVWKTTVTKNHTPPKGEPICKTCKLLRVKMY